MLLPLLVLQKPSATSKAKDHCEILARRLQAWHNGDVEGLVHEGRVIQRHLKESKRRQRSAEAEDDHLAEVFTKQMLQGKVRAAGRLLSQTDRGNVLALTQQADPSDPGSATVLDALKAKHPPAAPVDHDTLISDWPGAPESHPVIFDQITGGTIRRAALRCEGSAGPSGLDAAAWQRLCTAFKGNSTNLCNALALFTRRICTELVDAQGLAAFTACRLIALDKHPGVRPIGVAEVVRRIIGKSVLNVVGVDIQQVTGSTQLCAGQKGGCEAAIHATRMVFADCRSEGALLVDATNAFNQLNRQAALHNVATLCPSIATVLRNTYSGQAELFVGGTTLRSCEGTTQGDPLAMAFYSLATLPLIRQCTVDSLTGEVWFADDATGCGSIYDLRQWWDLLNEKGPKFGYMPNAAKTWLVVKEECYDQAQRVFHDTNVQITAEGKRHLGAALGTRSFVEDYVSSRVGVWVTELERLSAIALSQPQAAYSALVHGLLGKWKYLARTIPDLQALLLPLETSLRTRFIPALTGRSAPGDTERLLLGLPARLGGLGIVNPAASANEAHQGSLHLTQSLICELIQRTTARQDKLPEQLTKPELRQLANKRVTRTAADLREHLPADLKRAMDLASEKGASSWLTALPLEEHGFAIHKGAFRDSLCLRYGWLVDKLPSTCVCGSSFNAEHALSCPTGGLPTLRHNEVRDLLASLLAKVCHDVVVEPGLQPLSGEQFHRRSTSTDEEARLDIKAQGFWGGRFDGAFFDVRVFNPLAPSNRSSTITAAYSRHENAKINLYEERVREVERASFTPLVFSASGGASRLTTVFLKRLATQLSVKHGVAYSSTMAWLRARLSFSLLRSAVTCLRGTRVRPRRVEDDFTPETAISLARLSQ